MNQSDNLNWEIDEIETRPPRRYGLLVQFFSRPSIWWIFIIVGIILLVVLLNRKPESSTQILTEDAKEELQQNTPIPTPTTPESSDIAEQPDDETEPEPKTMGKPPEEPLVESTVPGKSSTWDSDSSIQQAEAVEPNFTVTIEGKSLRCFDVNSGKTKWICRFDEFDSVDRCAELKGSDGQSLGVYLVDVEIESRFLDNGGYEEGGYQKFAVWKNNGRRQRLPDDYKGMCRVLGLPENSTMIMN